MGTTEGFVAAVAASVEADSKQVEKTKHDIRMEKMRSVAASHAVNFQEYRRTILTLLTSEVGATFALLGLPYFKGGVHHAWILWVAWSITLVGIFASLSSFMTTDRAFSLVDGVLVDLMMNPKGSDDIAATEQRAQSFGLWTLRLNWISGISLVLSILLLLPFFFLNVSLNRPINTDKDTTRDEAHAPRLSDNAVRGDNASHEGGKPADIGNQQGLPAVQPSSGTAVSVQQPAAVSGQPVQWQQRQQRQQQQQQQRQ